jgi:hypothetical protein
MASPACLSAAVAVAAVYDQDLGREPNGGTYWSVFGGSFANCYDSATAGDKITCFSNRSGCNELAAPGAKIDAAWMGGGVGYWTGTSQAAPHCAGVAALVCEKASGCGSPLTPTALVQLMKSTGVATDDPAGTSPNPIRVDAWAAVTTTPPSQPSSEIVRLGSPPNPNAFLPGLYSGPVIGVIWNPIVTLNHPGVFARFVGVDFRGPINVPTQWGTLLIWPPPNSQLFFHFSPYMPFAIAVPYDCNLVGVAAWAQAGSIAPGPDVVLVNGLDIVFGTH